MPMYRLGETKHRHRKIYLALFSFLILVAGSGYAALHFFKTDTQINPPAAPVTTHLTYNNVKTVAFNTPQFSIDLPDDWKATVRSEDIPQPRYTWQGTLKDNANRWLSIYVDQAVSNLAVNRELSVLANGGQLNVLGDVSDNCINFTGVPIQGHGPTPAKWQGIDFSCDSGNYERDVVGVVSPNGPNNVTLVGPTSGSHRLFITYTDSSVSPDYTIFVNAVKSLQMK